MAISNIVNSINSRMRLSGLASGLDTDTIVKQMMAVEQAKVDKLIQKREISLWKTEAYRDVTSTLQSFYNEYFDSLSSKNLKSANSFSSFTSSYATGNVTDYVTVTPQASAKTGTYNITELKAATKASMSGGNISEAIVSARLYNANSDNNTPDVSKIKKENDNNTFVFTLNGKTAKFTVNDNGNITTVAGMKTELQTKIDDAFGSGKITVELDATSDGGYLKFKNERSTDTFSIGTAYNLGASTIFGAKPTADKKLILDSGSNKFDLSIGGGTPKTVTIGLGPDGTREFSSAEELKTAIENAVSEKFGSDSGITFEVKDGAVAFLSDNPASITQTKNGANAALGINEANMSNKINLTGKIYDINSAFATDTTITGDAGDIEFSINNINFKFSSKEASIKNIMDAVNSNVNANVSMKYDITTNSFSVESRNTGVTEKVDIKDISGGIMKTLGVNDGVVHYGSDARAKIDGYEVIVRPDNSFSYDGLTFNIKKDYPEGETPVDPLKVTITGDTSKTFDFIKSFVDKYNETIQKLNDKLSEKVYSDYTPLTDEQKAAMSEDQIKSWEEKAKSGLLKNDPIIAGVLSKLRSVVYDSVEGVGISLPSIGITTSTDYTQKGKLIIDETKLKEALANKGEEIADLFTKVSDTSYYEAIDDPALRQKRDRESGIANKFSDIIQDAIRTSTDKNGNKGTLLQKAGMVGDRSESTNLLYNEIMAFDKQITEMNSKLIDKEDALYKKFTAMETALNQMNSQASWIAQQFSGGNNG